MKRIFINSLWAFASVITFVAILFFVEIIICLPWFKQTDTSAKLSFIGSIGGAIIGVIGVYGVTSYSFNRSRNHEMEREFARHYVHIEKEIKNAKHVLHIINKLKAFADNIKNESSPQIISDEMSNLLYSFQTTKAPSLSELPENFSFKLRQDFKRYSIAANEYLEGRSRSLYSHYKVLRRIEKSGRLLVDEYDVDWFKANFSHLIKPDIDKISLRDSGDVLFEFHPNDMAGSHGAIRATCYSNSLLWIPYPLGIKDADKTIENLESEFKLLKNPNKNG